MNAEFRVAAPHAQGLSGRANAQRVCHEYMCTRVKPQRAKVERFALTHRFDHIQIEGEHGFGKPDQRAYRHAMQTLGVTAPETWMIGDNLEWEIEVPQRLGIYAIWMDAHGEGLPAESTVKPDRIIRSLTELLPVACR